MIIIKSNFFVLIKF